MSRLEWHKSDLVADSGIDRGVLYLADGPGLAWSGLVSVNEKANSAVNATIYFDGQRRIVQEVSEFGATIEAFTYPDEFSSYTGDEAFYMDTQPRPMFDFSYRTYRDPGYLIHLVYRAMVRPSDRKATTNAADINISPFVWELQASAVDVPNAKPSSHLVVDTNSAPADSVAALEDFLYGGDSGFAVMPSVASVMALFEPSATVTIVDNGDGTWTASGPDSMVRMTDEDAFEITQPDAVYIHKDVYTVATHREGM